MSNTVVDRFLDAVRTAGFAEAALFAADAVSDSTPPNWRLQVRGRAAVSAQYATWFDHPAELTELRRTPLPEGELLEYTRAWTEDGVAHKGHHIHRLTVADDRIVEDAHWCGGRWAQPLVDEISAAGHQV
jgi:hypothetical protein